MFHGVIVKITLAQLFETRCIDLYALSTGAVVPLRTCVLLSPPRWTQVNSYCR